jgi:glutathione synthase/RimK-type ligase-like ATP-grasp enzyme
VRVGLVGSPEREELQRLALRLEERGSEGVMLDPRGDPRIRMGPGRAEACGVDLTRLSAFYVADLALGEPGVVSGGSVEERARRRGDSQRRLVLWHSLLGSLALRCRVVNPPATWELHGEKPFEMAACLRLGLAVPRTRSTSSASALLDLPALVGGWIRKGLVGGYGYTQAFAPPRSAEEARALLADGPLLVQERHPGENVRAFVVGREVVGAAEVIPADPAEIDSRRETARVRRVALPEEAGRAALAATRRFGLLFSAVDFQREAGTGRFVLLECNSAPFFVEFERRAGVDVSSALADLLTERPRRRGE